MLCASCGNEIYDGDCRCETFVAGRKATVCLVCYNTINDMGYGVDANSFRDFDPEEEHDLALTGDLVNWD